MTKEREALKLTLGALKDHVGNYKLGAAGCTQQAAAIAAGEEALAQPDQEPLEYWNAVEGWVKIDEVRKHFEAVSCGTIYKTAGEGRVPLYTAPPKREWVGLNWGDLPEEWVGDTKFLTGARWAEQILEEKNHD